MKVLITGGTNGMGKGVAKALAASPDVPAELDAIAACTKSGAVMPEGCDWPPSELPRGR